MRFSNRRKDALEELSHFLSQVHTYVDLILVEGIRDVSSLRSLGCKANIEVLSHTRISDFDLAEEIASNHNSVLILTDFDVEGLSLNQRFSNLFERKGVKVEIGIRLWVGRLLARIGVYTIESLDNIQDEIV
jgi:5S rRNA maturation endonuclease (ribonuclease M5)